MFLDQKEECGGDFIYIYGNKRALLYTGGGVGGRGVVEGAHLPRASKTAKFGQIFASWPRGTVSTRD